MRRPIALLHENKVFSVDPNTFGGSSMLEGYHVQQEGNLFFSIDLMYNHNPYLLYKYDPMETYFFEERELHKQANKINAEFAKKIIVDGRFPAHAEFWLNDEFNLTGGRNTLIGLIKDLRYSAAIPELREVALHDDSEILRRNAILAFGVFGKKSDLIVNEILGSSNDRWMIMNITFYIGSYSFSDIYVPNLRKKFEEYYHDYVDDWLSLKWFKTVPQAIILACSRIPSIGALEILEEGLKHPYAHVEKTARTSVMTWLEVVTKSKSNDSKLIQKALEIGKKYDMKIMWGKGWDSFKKPAELRIG